MKRCFKCNETKPLDEFYAHPDMADGHLNKCKICNRQDTAERVQRMKKDPSWVEQELDRCREKMRKARAKGKYLKTDPDQKRVYFQRYRQNDPVRAKAHDMLGNAVRDGKVIPEPCEVCGRTDVQGHHEDYSKPLDVIWLCPPHHAARHVEIRRQQRQQARLQHAP